MSAGLESSSAMARAREAFERRQYADAASLVRERLAVVPDDPHALLISAQLMLAAQRPEPALAILDTLISTYSLTPFLALVRFRALQLAQRDAEAEAVLAHAEEAAGGTPELSLTLGEFLLSLGRREAAADAYRRALERKPDWPLAYRGLFRAQPQAADDVLAGRLAMLADDPDLTARDRSDLHYALAYAFKSRAPDRFMRHVLAANAAENRWGAAAIPHFDATFDRIEAAFSAEAVQQASAATPSNDATPTPIFIIGLWRSGTTLLESILARHPQVAAGGELNYIRGPFTWELEAMTKRPSPLGFETLTPTQWTTLAAGYRRRLALCAQSERYVTDKTPGEFHAIGLIRQCLPDAPIVLIERHPMDVAFSILQHPFAGAPAHTCDVQVLARYIKRYRALMNVWRVRLPGAWLDVRYEDVVTDTQRHGARIAEHCGLDWREDLAHPQSIDRSVRTFSAEQIRQPIYTSSIGAWRAHAEALAPLRAALEHELGERFDA